MRNHSFAAVFMNVAVFIYYMAVMKKSFSLPS